jgi:hypothetical protein
VVFTTGEAESNKRKHIKLKEKIRRNRFSLHQRWLCPTVAVVGEIIGRCCSDDRSFGSEKPMIQPNRSENTSIASLNMLLVLALCCVRLGTTQLVHVAYW